MADKTQFGLTAVDTVPLHEKVYLELVRALMSGQFLPGQKLTSRKLAKELGTSDMPVRSAFMRLQALRALSRCRTAAWKCLSSRPNGFRS
ncbi:GntR family transcriptional regulator [Mesorhizobium kowhaii]|uniref:GntR family transcriptional regulator n=1 Tax=Mesorhizobium kowhaii TaxID=1300272 RepID=UPI0035E8A207